MYSIRYVVSLSAATLCLSFASGADAYDCEESKDEFKGTESVLVKRDIELNQEPAQTDDPV